MDNDSIYNTCYMLSERVKKLESKMDQLENEKTILSRAVGVEDRIIAKARYYC